MAPISSAPRSVEDIFKDYSGRRTGIIRALTHDVDEFYPLCDPEKENLCLYGHPNESWEVTLPAEEVPPELPEPALGINFARDGMVRRDWLSLVAMHSDSWLLSVAFYLAAPFNRSERKRLFSMINDLPAVFEVVTERKPAKEKPSADSGSKSRLNNTKRSNDGLVKNIKLADEAYVEDEDEHSETLCGTEPSPERDATTPRSDRDYLMMVELMKKMDMVIKQNAELTRRMKNIEDRQKHLKNTNVELNAALIRIQMKLDITPPGSEEDEEDRADSDSDSSSDTPLPENAPARNVRAPTVQKKKASTKQQQQAQQNGTTGEGNTSSGVHEEPVAPTLEATLPTPEIVLRGDVTMDDIRTPHLVEVQPEQQEEETASEIEDNNESQEEIPPTAQSKPGEGDASPPVSDHDIGPILRSLPISVHPPMVSETPPEPSDATPIPDDAAKKEKRSKKNADREATQAQEATIEERPKIRAVHPKSRLILPPSDSSSSSSEEDQGKTPPYSASNKERARIAQEEEEKEADSDYVPSG